VTLIPWGDSPHHFPSDESQPQRADWETLDPEHLDNLDEWVGYTWNIYHAPYLAEKSEPGPLRKIPDYFIRTIDLVKARVGDEVSIHGEVFSPFTHYMELLGYEPALMSLATDRGKARALLDRLTEASVAWARAQARHGVDAVLISSAFAGGSFISRKMYSEFVAPYERRVTKAVKAEGIPVYTHTCGKIGDRLDLMAETGTQGVDTLDPPPLGNVELAEAKRLVGDRLFIKGNMDPVALLAYQTKEQVIAEAARCLRDGAPGGGYILSTACSVAPRVEPWKLELLTPLAEEMTGGRKAQDCYA
jgi:MtaA/CmuA family methyltransferase